MNKPYHFSVLFVLATFLFCSVAGASDEAKSEWTGLTDYPRIEHFEQGSVQVDFPTLESWPDFRRLRAWLPVEVSLRGDGKPQIGSVYVQAVTEKSWRHPHPDPLLSRLI